MASMRSSNRPLSCSSLVTISTSTTTPARSSTAVCCLPEGEIFENLVQRNCAIGFDLQFCCNDAEAPDETSIITCDPGEAEFATLYALTDLGEAIALHDVDFSSIRADEVAAVARALFVALVNARRDPPDAAQRHEAGQAALTEPDRIA